MGLLTDANYYPIHGKEFTSYFKKFAEKYPGIETVWMGFRIADAIYGKFEFINIATGDNGSIGCMGRKIDGHKIVSSTDMVGTTNLDCGFESRNSDSGSIMEVS